MSVPKVSLDLDDLQVDTSHDQPLSPSQRSMVSESIRDGVETEKCVVGQYRTSAKQKQDMLRLLSSCSREAVPVEWVIDIADQSSGWFYATAYHFDDTTQMLHVMVPDKENPTFDGQVPLDHRTVHLIECIDGASTALFNRIVRDSIIKVKWELEWYEEAENGNTSGSWINSFARYYIRMANQLLVEDRELGNDARGFVIITADSSVRLLNCLKGKGEEDFSRLIAEEVVQSTPESKAFAEQYHVSKRSPLPASSQMSERGGQNDAPQGVFTRLLDMSKGLRECVDDLTDERAKRKEEVTDMAKLFTDFTLNGDLDAGLVLMERSQAIMGQAGAEQGRMDITAEDAKFLSHKLERQVVKAANAGAGSSSGHHDDEVHNLKKSLKQLKKEMDELRGQRKP